MRCNSLTNELKLIDSESGDNSKAQLNTVLPRPASNSLIPSETEQTIISMSFLHYLKMFWLQNKATTWQPTQTARPPPKPSFLVKFVGIRHRGTITELRRVKAARRSIQKQIEYRCLRDGKCLVIRLNRNRCQYCRFKKCLAVGMSRDCSLFPAVRYGRVPKRSRERSVEDNPSRVSTTAPDVISVVSPAPNTTEAMSPTSAVPNTTTITTTTSSVVIDNDIKQLAVYDIILGISQAHHANCNYTDERMRNLQRRPLLPPPRYKLDEDEDGTEDGEDDAVASSTAESLENDRGWLWQQFATCMTPSVQRVVEFAKRIPGFGSLGQDDQLILIKLGFFEVWLTHVARLTSSQSMVFDDGTTVTRQQLEIMYDTDFIASVIHFANTFNALALNDTEVGLFSAIVLLTADRPGVTDIKSIEHHKDKLIEALKVQVNRNHANEPQVFSHLLIKLPELRNLGLKHNNHLDWFRENWQKLVLPPLFAEIFDIPKSEDDLQ
ncbi:hypothetical protein HUJ05_004384 [Dendroctonus ponderosae]|nr:hypothetical protein HUJ05_004384 [Dendroctonus ponderosae]